MNAVKPITHTFPDGVERTLRPTHGAHRRIETVFGMNYLEAMKAKGADALPEILFALMHDEKGKPPADLTIDSLIEMIPYEADAVLEMSAVVHACFTNGRREKKELIQIARDHLKEMEEQMEAELAAKANGSSSGVSAPKPSDSATNNSGGGISIVKSKPESSDTPINSTEPTTDQESSQPQSITSTGT